MKSSYAVIWQSSPASGPLVGQLRLGADGLSLSGGICGREARLELPYESVSEARRSAGRIGALSTLEIECRDGDTVRLGSLEGLGTRSEIVETLQRIVTRTRHRVQAVSAGDARGIFPGVPLS